jgi:hypothetical protein
MARWWEEDRPLIAQCGASRRHTSPLRIKDAPPRAGYRSHHYAFARWIVGRGRRGGVTLSPRAGGRCLRNATPRAGALPITRARWWSFIKVPPSLELMSGNLGAIQDWLTQKEGPLAECSRRLAVLDPGWVSCSLPSAVTTSP